VVLSSRAIVESRRQVRLGATTRAVASTPKRNTAGSKAAGSAAKEVIALNANIYSTS
jgi:hypothetical protein